ncbi:MAG: AI-2E family transporter, partial [Geminicoccaceae bacterium]
MIRTLSLRTELLAALWIGMLAFGLFILSAARAVLIPLVFAIMLWVLFNGLSKVFSGIRLGPVGVPRWLAYTLSALTILAATTVVVRIISMQLFAFIRSLPRYQARLEETLAALLARFDIQITGEWQSLMADIDLPGFATGVAGSLGSFATSLTLVLLFFAFLLAEQRHFARKLAHLFPEPSRYGQVEELLERIAQTVQIYLRVKTITSALTAVISYLILRAVDLDFAAIWALLIFFLNFIPNIGSFIATTAPTLLALVQFSTIEPFLVVLLGVGSVQLLVGSALEPALMGRSLNLSGLVIITCLVIWGVLWGIAGLFLA